MLKNFGDEAKSGFEMDESKLDYSDTPYDYIADGSLGDPLQTHRWSWPSWQGLTLTDVGFKLKGLLKDDPAMLCPFAQGILTAFHRCWSESGICYQCLYQEIPRRSMEVIRKLQKVILTTGSGARHVGGGPSFLHSMCSTWVFRPRSIGT